ncbi:hypothetical protein C8F04DRAFT_1397146 [Mycena alexandri]|uniref:Uncharacterized protein n=1 Tax=Mycena alexandri TaxID=1745969 RepID=A0AAD6SQ78_9AGAR|nr:hypothetical protein C8F04DRAFT_1397146 [Mycena alexandri]
MSAKSTALLFPVSSSRSRNALFTTVILLTLITAALAAPNGLVNAKAPAIDTLLPRTAGAIGLGVVCTGVNFTGSCVEFVSAPFDAAHSPGGCAASGAPFVESVSSARGVIDGYTCFLFSEANCQGTRFVISGQIPNAVESV